ncbi:hypothetical protein [Meiothermus phage MMP17]|nr:hypothetical protein [Meiothermus phage MMP17]
MAHLAGAPSRALLPRGALPGGVVGHAGGGPPPPRGLALEVGHRGWGEVVGGHTWKRRNTRNTYCSASPPWPGWWAAFELGRNLGGLEGWRWAIGAGVRW